MKVLLLSRYSRLGPSSRLRLLDHLPWLADQGVEAIGAPFFDDDYLEAFFRTGRRPFLPVLQAYMRRLNRLLVQAPASDLLWIEKELLPWLPFGVESALLRRPYVLDLDDAWFERYAGHPAASVRWLLGDKLSRLAAGARLVIVGNQYLGAWAQAAGAANVAVIPTSVDVARILPSQFRHSDQPSDSRFVIGWVGSPTSAPYLLDIAPALRHLGRLPNVVIRIVGGGRDNLPGIDAEFRPWTEANEAAEIADIDVGIMPLPDTPWTRGKCGFKILQYFAGARAAVASPVGANRDIIDHGSNGFLATSPESWVDCITRLRDDQTLRQRMGAAGRAMVERSYSHQTYRTRLLAALQQAAA